MKKLISGIVISAFLSLPAFAGDVKTFVITSGTQMAPSGTSIVKVVDVGDFDLTRWEFTFQFDKDSFANAPGASGNTIVPIFYCSNESKLTTTASTCIATGETNYIQSGGTPYDIESGQSVILNEFTTGVTPCSQIAFGFICGTSSGLTPIAYIHMR